MPLVATRMIAKGGHFCLKIAFGLHEPVILTDHYSIRVEDAPWRAKKVFLGKAVFLIRKSEFLG